MLLEAVVGVALMRANLSRLRRWLLIYMDMPIEELLVILLSVYVLY